MDVAAAAPTMADDAQTQWLEIIRGSDTPPRSFLGGDASAPPRAWVAHRRHHGGSVVRAWHHNDETSAECLDCGAQVDAEITADNGYYRLDISDHQCDEEGPFGIVVDPPPEPEPAHRRRERQLLARARRSQRRTNRWGRP